MAAAMVAERWPVEDVDIDRVLTAADRTAMYQAWGELCARMVRPAMYLHCTVCRVGFHVMSMPAHLTRTEVKSAGRPLSQIDPADRKHRPGTVHVTTFAALGAAGVRISDSISGDRP